MSSGNPSIPDIFPFTKVNSSSIYSFSFNVKAEMLFVRFKSSDAVYAYYNVAREIMEELYFLHLNSAQSFGRVFGQNKASLCNFKKFSHQKFLSSSLVSLCGMIEPVVSVNVALVCRNDTACNFYF